MEVKRIDGGLRARALLGREDRTLALVRPSAPVRARSRRQASPTCSR
jgi:hypothetical protein